MSELPERPAGIPGSSLTGPWPVGQYAAALREQLRGFTRVQVFGEVVSFKAGRAKVWFELRDGSRRAAVLDVADRLRRARARPAGRRRAGRGRRRLRLLPRLAHRLAGVLVRRRAAADRRRGRSAGAARAAAPRAARGRACSRTRSSCRGRRCRARSAWSAASTARRATTCWPPCERRGWRGRVVWAFAPVQDRHAAPAITRALQDLAACAEVEAIVVARGGGSLADLFAFCDETLCRTVALLRVPVISSVGHHTDRTLLDDVAAVACSTPTHAAEAAVPLDCAAARRGAGRGRRRGWSARAGARSSSAPARSRGSRARRPRTSSATARGCTSTCASCARARAAGVAGGERGAARPGRRRWPARRGRPSWPARAASCARARTAPRSSAASTAALERRRRDLDRFASRSPPTIRSARSSAATRSSRTAPASRWPRPPPRATQRVARRSACTTAASRCVRSRP